MQAALRALAVTAAAGAGAALYAGVVERNWFTLRRHEVPVLAPGWLDVNNQRGRVKAADLDIEVGGVHDSHIRRDRYDHIAGPTDPAADLRLGVLHSPEPTVMDRFAADGYDLLLAGHTHGGQVCPPGIGDLG